MQCSCQFLISLNPTDERSCFKLQIKNSLQPVIRGILFRIVSNWENGSLLNLDSFFYLYINKHIKIEINLHIDKYVYTYIYEVILYINKIYNMCKYV